MTFLVSQIDDLRAELAALPPPDLSNRKVGKRAAVAMMAKELQTLVRRGYTTTELIAVLAKKGLTVHKDTLRRALRDPRTTGAVGAAPRRRGSVKETRIEVGPPAAASAVAADSVENGVGTGKGKGGSISPRLGAESEVRGGTMVVGPPARPAAGTPAASKQGPPVPGGQLEGLQVDHHRDVGAAPARSDRDQLHGRSAGRGDVGPPVGKGTFTPRNDSDEI